MLPVAGSTIELLPFTRRFRVSQIGFKRLQSAFIPVQSVRLLNQRVGFSSQLVNASKTTNFKM